MTSQDRQIPYEIFNFSGQTYIETWSLKEIFQKAGYGRYNRWLIDELALCMQKIRDLADAFSFWQHRKWTGRKPIFERDLLIGFLLKQFFIASFRQTMGLMNIFKEYFRFRKVPHHSVLSRKNRSRRWQILWRRFHKFVINLLPERKSIISTDATGYSNRKKHWNDVDYGIRAKQDWVKSHACVETDTFLILNYSMTKSNVHDSREFESLWNDLPDNIKPIRSLADNAYFGEECLEVVVEKGAVPFHKIRGNAIHKRYPETLYQKMANFAIHWPNRHKELYGKRNHSETAFSMVDAHFGYRVKCRSKMGKKNEIQSKYNAHNIRVLAALEYFNRS